MANYFLVDSKFTYKAYYNLFDRTYRPIISEQEYDIQDSSRIGGFTAYNPNLLQIDNKNIETYDVNGMCPYFIQQGLPYGEILNKKPKDIEVVEWYICHMTKCEYRKKYKIFNNLPVPNNWLSGDSFYILPAYFDLIQTMCITDIKVIKKRYQLKTDELSGFIDRLYKIKQTTTDDQLKQSVKLVMNSLFGKFVEKVYKKIQKYNKDKLMWETKYYLPDEIKYKTCLSGIYICNMARVYLITSILEELENGNEFVYSDTDSMKLIVRNPVKLKIDKNELGAWKYEGSYTHYRNFRVMKKYFLFNSKDPAQKPQICLSGVKNQYVSILLKQLTLEDWLSMFDFNNNYLLKGMDSDNTHNALGQTLINTNNIVLNPNLKKVTHIIELVDNTVVINKL